jgi:TrmH family RNA methyltransferase
VGETAPSRWALGETRGGGRSTGPGLDYRHPRVQRLRRLLGRRSARENEHRFVIEGANLLEEALRAQAEVEAVFLGAGWDRTAAGPEGQATGSEGRLAELVERSYATGARVFELAPGALERVAGTVSPQPVMAVCAMPEHGLEELRAAHPQLLVVCVDVRDPGNAGTLVRSAWAAGVSGVVCSLGTVDIWNPKAVRSSAGAVFHVPVVQAGAPGALLDELGAWGLDRWGAVPEGGTDYDRLDLTRPCAFVVGNEAAGLPVQELLAHLDGLVSIPMPGGAESLNVGTATAVLCFEALRQRRGGTIALPGGLAAGKLASS